MSTAQRETSAGIAEEVEVLLSGMGFPFADTADRRGVAGVLVGTAGTGAATVEWLVSATVRQTAAREQIEGQADGPTTSLHRTARSHVHRAIAGILEELGYAVAETPAGLRVEGTPGTSFGAQTIVGLSGTAPVVLCHVKGA